MGLGSLRPPTFAKHLGLAYTSFTVLAHNLPKAEFGSVLVEISIENIYSPDKW